MILGGSSGIGLATAKRLARNGYKVGVVHRDRRGAMERIEKEFAEIRAHAPEFFSLNLDALNPEGVTATCATLLEKTKGEPQVRLLLHSIAFGNLKPLETMEEEDMARTIHAMGTSLLTWTQKLRESRLLAPDSRIVALTSEGNTVAWKGYAAVSAAKCALEAVSRSIAVELGPQGVRSNVIQAGVTDTPALRLIPGHEGIMQKALARNPLGRLTTPEDVANVVAFLGSDAAAWINGTILRVDGGEAVGS